MPHLITSAQHQLDLEASGLTAHTWHAAGLWSESDGRRVGDLLGWRYSARRLGTCLVFPYIGIDGQPLGYHRVKPANPRRGQKQKPIKYEAPKKERPRPYFPPLFRDIYATADFIVIVEGEKKALCTSQHGFATIGLCGVWSWSFDHSLLPELAALNWNGRRVFIVFDSDRLTNEDVRKAESRLAAKLTQAGATVRVAGLLRPRRHRRSTPRAARPSCHAPGSARQSTKRPRWPAGYHRRPR
jgi:putative DNA primase/helicase